MNSIEEERELVIEIYKAVISCLDGAISAASKTNELEAKIKGIETAHNYLVKVREIIAILIESVEDETGVIAINLSKLYWHSYLKVVESNLRKDPVLMEEVKKLFVDLLEGYSFVPPEKDFRPPNLETSVQNAKGHASQAG